MTTLLFLKTLAIWCIMVVAAILNGGLRDQVLAKALGEAIALPLSGVTLSMLVFLISYFAAPWLGKHKGHTYIVVGGLWVLFTLLFEFPFGHFVMGKSWPDLLQVFDFTGGNLFALVLLVSLLSPYLAARLRLLII